MDEEPHWGRGVALRRCYSRVGKKMERGWTGEKGRRCVDPGRCRIDPRPRASIYRLRLHPAQWRLDPPPPRLHLHLSLLNLPSPPSSGAAAPRSTAAASIRCRHRAIRHFRLDPVPPLLDPPPPPRSGGGERGAAAREGRRCGGGEGRVGEGGDARERGLRRG